MKPLNGQGSHKVKRGETLITISKKWGISKWQDVWNDPENSKLKSNRGKPEAIDTGDVIFIPFTKKQKLDIMKKRLHYINLAAGEVELARVFKARAETFQKACNYAESRIDNITKSRENLEKSMLGVAKDAKATAKVIDIMAEVLTVLVNLGRLAKTASTAAGAELAKLNKEAMGVVTGTVTGKVSGAAKEAGIKYLLDPKNPVSAMGLKVGIYADAESKMMSPSFWGKTIARMKESKKDFSIGDPAGLWEAWCEAVNFDLEADIKNQFNHADRFFIPAKKKAIREWQEAVKSTSVCLRMASAALAREKIHLKKLEKIPDILG